MFIEIQENKTNQHDLRIEGTPNPNTLKFILGFEILPERQTISFQSIQDCDISNLAKKIWAINNVTGIFYGHDFISVTTDNTSGWHKLKHEIVCVITDYHADGQPILNGIIPVTQNNHEHLTVDEQEIIQQIVEVINEKVRPAVAQDGGDITFHSYNNGIVYLTMHGACRGCPSSTLTLKDGIENMLKHYIPEVLRVEQI